MKHLIFIKIFDPKIESDGCSKLITENFTNFPESILFHSIFGYYEKFAVPQNLENSEKLNVED